MNWGNYLFLFGLATIKFMFAPFAGPIRHLTFWETYLSCVAGAFVCSLIFYFSAELFLIRAHNKRKLKRQQAIEKGIPFKEKKRFTRVNKTIVRVKHRFGLWIMALYAPFFLSVPLGSIITAKFYGKDKRTYPIIVLGICVNGVIMTGIAYLFRFS